MVVNRTGLTGHYEFKLTFSPQSLKGVNQPSTDDLPTLTAALEEQLGLRLVAQDALLEILVVDHIERPGED